MQTLSSATHSWLAWFYKGLLLFGTLILMSRLFELQIIKGAYYHTLADNNRIRHVPIHAARGQVLARNGEILVDNIESQFTVSFSPESGFEKITPEKNSPQEEIITESVRTYPLADKFAHVSGYLGEVNEEEVGKSDPACLEKGPRKIGTLVGRSGLEKQYDCTLRGIDGEELVEVDTFGNKIRVLGRKKPTPGESLATTIDYGLQKIISARLQDKKGVIIASTRKGEILALYSSPSFNPNIFVDPSPLIQDKITETLTDKDLPMFNRAIGGSFHPGSVYKPLVAITALETGAIDQNYTYDDQGFIKIDEFIYNNWYFTQYGGKEGQIDLPRALARSTDTFFYKIGELTGIDNIVEWSRKFNLDKRTNIDLPGEIKSLVPSPEWKKAVKGERWYLGNTYHMSIGQGDLSLTPIAVHMTTTTIANRGQYCPPHISQTTSSDCQDLGISESNIDYVVSGMTAACSEGGTAFPFFDFVADSGLPAGRQAACKTGTAETNEEDETHAWFTVFAPAKDPEIVLTILIEKGGEGSADAAPLAKEILDYWFHNR